MGIPEIRERLIEMSVELCNQELYELAQATRRKKPLRPLSKRKYKRLSYADAMVVRLHYLEGSCMQDLALIYDTNIGRISEAVNA